MKPTFITLLALCLCVPVVGADKKKEEFEQTKAKAEKGDAFSQYILGYMYSKGQGVPKDFREAVKWFRKAAEQGQVLAQITH